MLAYRAFDDCGVYNIPQFSRRVRDLKQTTRETITGKFLKEGFNIMTIPGAQTWTLNLGKFFNVVLQNNNWNRQHRQFF